MDQLNHALSVKDYSLIADTCEMLEMQYEVPEKIYALEAIACLILKDPLRISLLYQRIPNSSIGNTLRGIWKIHQIGKDIKSSDFQVEGGWGELQEYVNDLEELVAMDQKRLNVFECESSSTSTIDLVSKLISKLET